MKMSQNFSAKQVVNGQFFLLQKAFVANAKDIVTVDMVAV